MNESQQEKYDRLITRVCNHLAYYLLHYPNDWVGIFLQGSQNYDLEYEGSDVDTKIIVLPSLEDIALNKQPISTTLITEDNEHVDVKDIRLMFDASKSKTSTSLRSCTQNGSYSIPDMKRCSRPSWITVIGSPDTITMPPCTACLAW